MQHARAAAMAIPGVSVKTNSTMKSGARPSSCMPLQSAVCIAPLGGALPKARLSRKAQHHSEIHDIMCHQYILAALPSKRVLSLRFSLSSPFACVACPTLGDPWPLVMGLYRLSVAGFLEPLYKSSLVRICARRRELGSEHERKYTNGQRLAKTLMKVGRCWRQV